jgi:hypothetical protein
MLTTIHIGLSWADDAMRVTASSFQLRIQDPRVLLAAHRMLLAQPGALSADLVSSEGRPYFAVALELPPLLDPVDHLETYVNDGYTAQTVASGGQVKPLQAVELRLRLELIG